MQKQRTAVVTTRGSGTLPKLPPLGSCRGRGHLSAAKHTKVATAAAAKEATLLLKPATFAAETPARWAGAAEKAKQKRQSRRLRSKQGEIPALRVDHVASIFPHFGQVSRYKDGPPTGRPTGKFKPSVAVYNPTIRPPPERGHTESMHKSKKIVIIGGCGHVGLPLASCSPTAAWTLFFSIAIKPRSRRSTAARCPSWKPTPWNS